MTMPTLAILRVMVADQDSARAWYGLELTKKTGIKAGTMYAILSRLSRNGWLEEWWEEIDESEAQRPRRHLFRLTSIGRSSAIDALAAAREQII